MSTKIQWTQETWNPILGCSKVSLGCMNCYAIKEVHRMASNPNEKVRAANQGLTFPHGGNWTGAIRFLPERLQAPLKRKKPTTWFVNSLGDLFHEDIKDEWLHQIFAVMALTPHHTYQILTKRPRVMWKWFTEFRQNIPVYDAAAQLISGDWSKMPGDMANARSSGGNWWPLKNVHLGVSVENQKAAKLRIPLLLQTPAAVRFLSCEPLLEAVDLSQWLINKTDIGQDHQFSDRYGYRGRLHWVICGGESGKNARPCNIEWIRSIVRQCQNANVPVFCKQLGSMPYEEPPTDFCDPTKSYRQLKLKPKNAVWTGTVWSYLLPEKKGDNPEEWPEDLRVRQMPKQDELRM